LKRVEVALGPDERGYRPSEVPAGICPRNRLSAHSHRNCRSLVRDSVSN
jgi:hypothetical protein